LRKTYGEHFAKGRRKDMMLKTLLAGTAPTSPIAGWVLSGFGASETGARAIGR
jgi:hypothetical protein